MGATFGGAGADALSDLIAIAFPVTSGDDSIPGRALLDQPTVEALLKEQIRQSAGWNNAMLALFAGLPASVPFAIGLAARIISELTGLPVDDLVEPWLSNPVVGNATAAMGSVIGTLGQFQGALMDFLGNINFLDPDFDPEDAIASFITLMLLPSGLIPELIGGLLPTSIIPGLDASKIITGTFSAGSVQPLIDAVSQGFGGSTGLNFSTLQSFLGGLSFGGIDFDDLIALFPGIAGGLSGDTGLGSIFTDLTGLLGSPTGLGGGTPTLPAIGSIPILSGLLSGGSILPSIIPGLDASKIVSGMFSQAMISDLVDDLAGKLTDSSLLDAANLFGFNTVGAVAITATYSQSNVYGTLEAASMANMANNDASEESATGMGNVAGNFVKMDLGSSLYVDHVTVGYDHTTTLGANDWGPGFTEGWTLQVSNDNSTWTDIADTPVYASSGAVNGIVSMPVAGTWRYLRLYYAPAEYRAVTEFAAYAEGVLSGADLFDNLVENLFGTNAVGSTLIAGAIPGLDVSKIVSGVFGTGFIPGLDASKIITGTFGTGLIPGLDVSKIVSGVFSTGFIPNLAASKITSGTFGTSLIPGLDTSKIISGTFAQSMVSGLPAMATNLSTLFSAVDFTSGSFTPSTALLPYGNVIGALGLSDIGGTSQAIIDNFISGFVNLVGTGASLPDAYSVANIVGSQSFLGKVAYDIAHILDNKSMQQGMLPSSTSTVGLDVMATFTTLPTASVTTANTLMGFQRFEQEKTIGAISWLGSGIASLTGFYVDIWKFDPDTNSFDWITTSGNVLGNLAPTMQYNIVTLIDDVPVVEGDILAAELIPNSATGTVAHTVAALNSNLPNHPTVLPKNMGARKNMNVANLPQMGRSRFDDRKETWDDNVLDTTYWQSIGSGASVTGGRVQITNSNSGYSSITPASFLGKQVWVEVPLVITGASNTQLSLHNSVDTTDFIRIYQNGGNLFFDAQVNGVVNQTSVAYNATTHRWWGISLESSTTIVFRTSTNGWEWTDRRSLALPAGIDASSMYVQFFGGSGGSGNAQFDNYNIVPAANLGYSSTFPWIEFAVDATPSVGVPYHSPVTTSYAGSTSYVVEDWVNTIEVIVLGGGGAGHDGAFGFTGQGGGAGNWNATTWTRGTHFSTGSSITLSVGAGGLNSGSDGLPGGTTTATRGGYSVSATGGAGATASATSGADVPGDSAGNYTYNGATYVGGGQQNSQGSAGIAPGGGGCGGPQPGGNGGNGARGQIWLKKIQ